MSDSNKAGIAGKITAAPKPLELFGRRDAFTAHIAVCRNSGLTDDVKIVFTRSAIDTAGHEKEMEMPFFDNEDLLTIGKDVIIPESYLRFFRGKIRLHIPLHQAILIFHYLV